MSESIEQMLTGGHANSLGRTIEVVDMVLGDPARFEELFSCYLSDDAVVRLRTSNALKRVEKEQHDWLVPYIDRLVNEISQIDQASTQWTMANLYERLEKDMTAGQRSKALDVMKRNLASSDDWIVLNETMRTLSGWAKTDNELKSWLKPHFKRLSKDERKSVAKRAAKLLAALG